MIQPVTVRQLHRHLSDLPAVARVFYSPDGNEPLEVISCIAVEENYMLGLKDQRLVTVDGLAVVSIVRPEDLRLPALIDAKDNDR